jgi:hypothetical protein
MPRKFYLLSIALFIASNSFGEAVVMVSKSGKMEHIPLHAVPLRLEGGSFAGCVVAQSRIVNSDITNKRSDAFCEFNAISVRNETCFAQFNIWKGLITTIDRQVQVLL